MTDNTAPMILRLLTPGGVAAEVACDSVQLPLREGADGRGGGLVGILRGHAPAVMALTAGEIHASLAGKTVFRARVKDGFASVEKDRLNVITDSAVAEEEK